MKQNFRTYPLALSAGQEIQFSVAGDFYAIVEATSPVTITFDESNRITNAEQGTGGRFPKPYENVKVKSPVAQTVVIVLGFGEFWDSRASANVTVNATVEPANSITELAEVSVPAGGSAQLAAADANRKELRVGVQSSAANGVYIGSATIGAGQGGYVEEGGVEYITSESAVYAYNAGANPITVNVVSLERI